MSASPLRVYYGPETEESRSDVEDNTVRLSLGEILPLLAEAYQSQRTWLGDFNNDEVAISSDLYEVLIAYRHYRPSA